MPASPPARVPAPLLVVGAVVSVQSGSALARTLFDDLGAAGVTLLRVLLASLLLLLVLRPRVWTWSAASWRAAALLGTAMAGMNLAFYLSLRTVPLGLAVTVEFIGPLLLALVQTRRALDLVWALLAGGGVALLGGAPARGVAWSGLALALLAGTFWAGYILASARVGRLLPGLDGLALALAVATVLVAPVGAGEAAGLLAQPSLLVPVLGVALLSSVLPYGLELHALRRLPTRVFGVLLSLEPAAAALAGLVVLHQGLRPHEVLAVGAISLASAGITLTRRPARDEEQARLPPQPLE